MADPTSFTEIAKIGGSFVAGILGGGAGHRIVNKTIATRLSDLEKLSTKQSGKHQDLERRLVEHIADNIRQHNDNIVAQGKTEDAVSEVGRAVTDLSKDLYRQYAELMKLLGEKVDRYEDRRRRP